MLKENVTALINKQINREFYSAYLYLDFSNFYNAKGLSGFANWYLVQAQEERDHALLFYQYLHNNGVRVQLEAIERPDAKLETLLDAIKEGLEHEVYVTNLIHNIYAAANESRDFRTMQFLDWFIKEQGEEEKMAQDLITKMELFGDEPKSLYMLDNELKTRVYNPPTLVI